MKSHVINIPFAQLAPLLPEDGERFTVWQGEKRWPRNASPFERHETLEIAFGKAIRAQADHRAGEKWRKPGFAASMGYLQVRGGWAAHKHVPIHNDYFDGTFDASVQVAVSAGRIRCKVLSLSLTWNASLAARLLDVNGLVRRFILDIVERKVVAMLSSRIDAAITQLTRDLQRQLPGASLLRKGISLAVLPGKLMLMLQYEEKPAPGRVVVARRKVAAGALERMRSGDARR